MSDATGQAGFAVKIGGRDLKGTWVIASAATESGASGSAAMTFIVQ